MIKPAMWQAIDGDITPCELNNVAQLLPTPLQMVTRDETLVVISYDDWKRRVLRVQAQSKEKTLNSPEEVIKASIAYAFL